MKKRSFLWVLFTTTAFAAAVLMLTPAGQAVGDRMRPILVRVINTASEPVPVTGTTSLTGTADVNVLTLPAVQAQQSGAWAVGIVGTPTVNVSSLPTLSPVRGNFSAIGQPIGSASQSLVLANTIVTDIYASFTRSEDALCALSVIDSATGALLISHALGQDEPYSLNLTTGLQGPLTIGVTTTGVSGTCTGDLTWTGVTQ